jgi:hypothetical protein
MRIIARVIARLCARDSAASSLLLGAAAAFAFVSFPSSVLAKTASDAGDHVTLVVFADHSMQSAEWTELRTALHTAVADGGSETQDLDHNAEFVRGDEIVPGLSVTSPITVFLHGDCALAPLFHRSAFGVPLGWVSRIGGEIEPFVHVDCAQIADVLGTQAVWLSREGRVQVMAHAIARVIVHEWIHIATQSSVHAGSGVEKAQYGAADLMGEVRVVPWPRF